MKELNSIDLALICSGANEAENPAISTQNVSPYFQLICGVVAVDLSKQCLLDPIFKILLEPTQKRINQWACKKIESILDTAQISHQDDRDFLKYLTGMTLMSLAIPLLVKTTVRV